MKATDRPDRKKGHETITMYIGSRPPPTKEEPKKEEPKKAARTPQEVQRAFGMTPVTKTLLGVK